MDVLALGPKFAPTPKNIPTSDFAAAIEDLTRLTIDEKLGGPSRHYLPNGN